MAGNAVNGALKLRNRPNRFLWDPMQLQVLPPSVQSRAPNQCPAVSAANPAPV